MKNKKNIKIAVIILSIVLVVIAISTATYSLFYSESTAANPESYSTGLLSITATSKSDNISLTDALPMTDEDGINSTPYTFSIKNIGNLDYKFNIKLLSTSSNTISPQYIKLKIDDGEVTTLSSLTNSIIKSDVTLKAKESIDITIRAWLSIDTPNSEIGKTFNSKLVADGQAVYTTTNYNVEATLYITNLFNPNTTAVNNGITYNLDSTNNLMKDVAGNIRYYGASPNNYIDIGDTYKSDVTKGKWEEQGFANQEECLNFLNCSINYAEFGYSSEDECNSDLPAIVQQEFGMTIEEFNNTYCVVETIPKGTPILYRIIGVFGDKIKVIRNESIGEYSWDTSASTVNGGSGINEWSGADLMKLLNPGYDSESIGGSLWYNSASGTCYSERSNATTSCDFTITGLSDNVKNKIAEVTWNLGGWNNSEVYPNQIYEYERGTNVISSPRDGITRTTSWTGKVALAYPSDYGYAADLTHCSQTLYNYDSSTNSYACRSNNWLYNSATQWLLTPSSLNAFDPWYVHSAGGVILGDGAFMVCSAFGVRPVLYLNSELVIESGSGTESDPYRISA